MAEARHISAFLFFGFDRWDIGFPLLQRRCGANALPDGTFATAAIFLGVPKTLPRMRAAAAWQAVNQQKCQCPTAAWPLAGPTRRINKRTIGTSTAANTAQL